MKKFLAVCVCSVLFSLAAHADKALYGAWWTTSTPGAHGAAKPAGALNVTLVGYDGVATTGTVNLDSEDATTIFHFHGTWRVTKPGTVVVLIPAPPTGDGTSWVGTFKVGNGGFVGKWFRPGVAKGSFQTTEN